MNRVGYEGSRWFGGTEAGEGSGSEGEVQS